MKYFVTYISFKDGVMKEYLFKARTASLLESQFKRCADGAVSTINFTIYMEHVKSIFLQEITDYTFINKREFVKVNETRSYCLNDLLEEYGFKNI
ncbi:hypothetical protein ACIQZM_18540 [Peribacillus sp. NPDC097206]|uniref:hypothetical protein n=1 Tax=Peribacillus sp. NPDC097206 TaxID=3364398 RepID=UPI0037F2959C